MIIINIIIIICFINIIIGSSSSGSKKKHTPFLSPYASAVLGGRWIKYYFNLRLSMAKAQNTFFSFFLFLSLRRGSHSTSFSVKQVRPIVERAKVTWSQWWRFELSAWLCVCVFSLSQFECGIETNIRVFSQVCTVCVPNSPVSNCVDKIRSVLQNLLAFLFCFYFSRRCQPLC